MKTTTFHSDAENTYIPHSLLYRFPTRNAILQKANRKKKHCLTSNKKNVQTSVEIEGQTLFLRVRRTTSVVDYEQSLFFRRVRIFSHGDEPIFRAVTPPLVPIFRAVIYFLRRMLDGLCEKIRTLRKNTDFAKK